MPKILITAGEKYIDIDALACAVAYRNLLELQKIDSQIIFTGPLNESITKTIRSWDLKIKSTPPSNPEEYKYVLVDISDHANISNFVPVKNIIEVYDHRWGFEDFWKDKSNIKTTIDTVGSCATLVWEKFKDLGLESNIDSTSANLLYTAIISNTLNLKAQITNQRDILALNEISKYTNLSNDWNLKYFNEVTESFIQNPVEAIKNDSKPGKINGEDFYIMQVELWDSKTFINTHKKLIFELIKSSNCENSFLTSPSISEGINYIIATNKNLKNILSEVIGAEFIGDIGTTDKLWLRKEIIREIMKLG